jgi:YbbR domain-containing protein
MPPLGIRSGGRPRTPAEVEVTGPASKVDDLKEIKTEPIDVRGVTRALTATCSLSWAGDFVSFTPEPRRGDARVRRS